MERVTSNDGTPIAYERTGSGPSVILIGGGLDDGSENAPLVPLLAERFTVINYARRGRGESGDTAPYAVAREIEDLEALIDETGGRAHLYGVSTGGALVLEAAVAGIAADRLAVYEVPFNMADDWPPRWTAYVEQLDEVLAAGRRNDALELFLKVTGASDEDIAGARNSPFWSGSEALAHTLAYDAACLGDGRPPVTRLARITQPTLVATGAGSQAVGAAEWMLALDPAADAIASSIPNAERQVFEGQSHLADPEVVASVLARFFAT